MDCTGLAGVRTSHEASHVSILPDYTYDIKTMTHLQQCVQPMQEVLWRTDDIRIATMPCRLADMIRNNRLEIARHMPDMSLIKKHYKVRHVGSIYSLSQTLQI